MDALHFLYFLYLQCFCALLCCLVVGNIPRFPHNIDPFFIYEYFGPTFIRMNFLFPDTKIREVTIRKEIFLVKLKE